MEEQRPENKERLPQVYYTRRRAAAMTILVAVVLLTTVLISRCGGGDDENTPTGEQVSETTSSAVETSTEESSSVESSEEESTERSAAASEPAPENPEVSGDPSAQPSTGVAAAADAPLCDLSQLQVLAATSQTSYTTGQLPVFYMTLRNPTEADCNINLDEQPLRFEVYDLRSNQRLWVDTDCNESVARGVITLQAGRERYYEARWSRTTSAPDQCNQRVGVPAGSYYLHTVVGDNSSAPASFSLV